MLIVLDYFSLKENGRGGRGGRGGLGGLGGRSGSVVGSVPDSCSDDPSSIPAILVIT